MDLRFLFTVIAEVLRPVTDVVDPALIVHDIYKMELADLSGDVLNTVSVRHQLSGLHL